MFLSREIDIKLCKNYTKSYIYQISYKIRSIKQTIFNNYATNLKKILYPTGAWELIILLCIVCTVGYYVTRTSTNSSAVLLSHVSRDQYTALPLAEVSGASLCRILQGLLLNWCSRICILYIYFSVFRWLRSWTPRI